MTVPGYQEFMFPILKFLSDETVHDKQNIVSGVAAAMKLTPQQLEQQLPSQTQRTYINRIGWALTYLKKAELIASPSRAHFKITAEGKKIADQNITTLNTEYLKQFPAFRAFVLSSHADKKSPNGAETEETPFETMLECHSILKKNVCDDLLNKILEQSPYSFEQLVVDLIVAMGYGGNSEDAGRATKKSGDEGIDGLVKEDKLGLDTIYIQAKRYAKDNYVGHPAIQQFIGALQLQGARKGIFITTSDFTKQAVEAIKKSSNISVILINGQKLVDLMYEYNIGVSVEKRLEIKRIDSDYFDGI